MIKILTGIGVICLICMVIFTLLYISHLINDIKAAERKNTKKRTK